MAINPGAVDAQAFTATKFGFRVDRASATLPASTSTAYFTIAGGRVLILGIVGEVTTIIQAQACNLKLISTPTTGSAVDICAVLDVNGKEAGCLFGITGTFATALVGSNAGAGVMCATPVVAPIGSIKLSASATNTGATKWSIYWVPLDDGAGAEVA
jgi:hypothetical protein